MPGDHRIVPRFPPPGGRAHLVLQALAGHPAGLTSVQIAGLEGAQPTARKLTSIGQVLRRYRDLGMVELAGRTSHGWQRRARLVYTITPAGRHLLGAVPAPGPQPADVAWHYLAGHLPAEVARGYHISTAQVKTLLAQAGVPLRTPAEQNRITWQKLARRRLHQPLALPVPGEREEQVLEAYCDRKLTLADSGRPLGLSGHQVRAILQRHGVERRRPAPLIPAPAPAPGSRTPDMPLYREAEQWLRAWIAAAGPGARLPGSSAIARRHAPAGHHNPFRAAVAAAKAQLHAEGLLAARGTAYYTPGTFDVASLRRRIEHDLREQATGTPPGTPLPAGTLIALAYADSQIPRSRILPAVADARRALQAEGLLERRGSWWYTRPGPAPATATPATAVPLPAQPEDVHG